LVRNAGVAEAPALEFGGAFMDDYTTVCVEGRGKVDAARLCNLAADDFTRTITPDPSEHAAFVQSCLQTSGSLSDASASSSTVPTAAAQGSSCNSLRVGCDALVANTGTWLNVRGAPSINAVEVGRLKDVTTLSIVGGPSQSDGYTWWQINSTDTAGWGAEGEKD